jgi:hypothetical protein
VFVNSSLKIFTKKLEVMMIDIFLCLIKCKVSKLLEHLAINMSAINRLDLHYPCYAPFCLVILNSFVLHFFSNHFIFTYSLIRLCFIWFLISLSLMDSVWILPIPLHLPTYPKHPFSFPFSYSILTLSLLFPFQLFYFKLYIPGLVLPSI